MNLKPRIIRYGERAILLQWDFKIASENLQFILSIKKYLCDFYIKRKVYINNTYNSLLVVYRISIDCIYDDLLYLKTLDFSTIKLLRSSGNFYRIPVCYDLEFGLDLEFLATQKSMQVNEIINLHTAADYTLYFMGFLPGFLYLGGMPETLAYPRKIHPRKSILKGAVGIAENQTGIYPTSSPAGWQIIGNSPVNLFDKNKTKPSPFKAGDRIKFYEITLKEHQLITNDIAQGTFQLKPETDV